MISELAIRDPRQVYSTEDRASDKYQVHCNETFHFCNRYALVSGYDYVDQCQVLSSFVHCLNILYLVFSNRHRLKAVRGQPPPYSNEFAPTFVSSPDYQPNGPQVPPIAALRCTICYGRRSPLYHRNHTRDPIGFPAAGVCSRRRTKCKLYQARWSASAMGLPAIPELPADSHMTETESSLKKPRASR